MRSFRIAPRMAALMFTAPCAAWRSSSTAVYSSPPWPPSSAAVKGGRYLGGQVLEDPHRGNALHDEAHLSVAMGARGRFGWGGAPCYGSFSAQSNRAVLGESTPPWAELSRSAHRGTRVGSGRVSKVVNCALEHSRNTPIISKTLYC